MFVFWFVSVFCEGKLQKATHGQIPYSGEEIHRRDETPTSLIPTEDHLNIKRQEEEGDHHEDDGHGHQGKRQVEEDGGYPNPESPLEDGHNHMETPRGKRQQGWHTQHGKRSDNLETLSRGLWNKLSNEEEYALY